MRPIQFGDFGATGAPCYNLSDGMPPKVARKIQEQAVNDIAKILMIAGASLFLLGILFAIGSRIPWFGNLPGDIVVKRDNFTLFVPLGTMILLSVALTVVLNLIGRLFR